LWGACGAELPPNSKFCNECGLAVAASAEPAGYKQVTVRFADVVHSMDIAAAVGAERLRETMTELVSHCASVIQRYGGTVDKFTGDGVMAVFGAPVALEDHAFRACLAALHIQAQTVKLAKEVEARDGIALQLRVGLNSGQVIAGEIGSGALGYTAIGEQVRSRRRGCRGACPRQIPPLRQGSRRAVRERAWFGALTTASPTPAAKTSGARAGQRRRRDAELGRGRQSRCSRKSLPGWRPVHHTARPASLHANNADGDPALSASGAIRPLPCVQGLPSLRPTELRPDHRTQEEHP
jgi:adenylate cyclase